MTTVHSWDADGKHFRAVYDDDYDPRGSYACGNDHDFNGSLAKLGVKP